MNELEIPITKLQIDVNNISDIQYDNNNNINKLEELPVKLYLKSIRYKDEQQNLLLKLYEIIGITSEKKEFYTHEIDFNSNIKKAIDDLIPDIKKYFSASTWGCMQKKRKTNKIHLSLIRFILKNMNVKYKSLSCKFKLDGKYINSTLYTIL